MIYSCLFEICGLMRRRPGERIPEGEMKRKPFVLLALAKTSSSSKHHRNSTIEAA
jgi:7,8-dihydro-6-hydroxymethylpterin-pyrophosphokinase